MPQKDQSFTKVIHKMVWLCRIPYVLNKRIQSVTYHSQISFNLLDTTVTSSQISINSVSNSILETSKTITPSNKCQVKLSVSDPMLPWNSYCRRIPQIGFYRCKSWCRNLYALCISPHPSACLITTSSQLNLYTQCQLLGMLLVYTQHLQ